MSDKFLGTGNTNVNLTNGSANIYALSLGALELLPNFPVKTTTAGRLTAQKLEISDVNNLQSTIDSLSGGNAKTVNITDAIANTSTLAIFYHLHIMPMI